MANTTPPSGSIGEFKIILSAAKQGVKTTGSYKGKSNKLGYGGRSKQLKDMGVPGGVIGTLARASGTAPGGPHYHGKKKTKN